jgi:endonuclease YncB( thermonuclease family)
MAVVAISFIGVFAYALSSAPNHLSVGQPLPDASAIASSQEVRRAAADNEAIFMCEQPRIVDGDTIRCGDRRVRLASIDAPEMPGHCRRGRACVDGDPFASKASLERLMAAGPTRCRQTDTDHYGRVIAFCDVAGRDLSCAQVENGFAITRYGALNCPMG